MATYTVNYNDGSDNVVYEGSLPKSFRHTYTNGAKSHKITVTSDTSDEFTLTCANISCVVSVSGDGCTISSVEPENGYIGETWVVKAVADEGYIFNYFLVDGTENVTISDSRVRVEDGIYYFDFVSERNSHTIKGVFKYTSSTTESLSTSNDKVEVTVS